MLEIMNMATERSLQFTSNKSTSLSLDIMYRNVSINYLIINIYFIALFIHKQGSRIPSQNFYFFWLSFIIL